MKKEPKKRAKRVKRPKHAGEIRAVRFAVRHGQDCTRLHEALDLAWRLRNDLAVARAENSGHIRDAKRSGLTPPKRLTKRDQEMTAAERRKRDPKGIGRLHSLVVKNTVDRIDEGYKRFWEALAEGRPGVRPTRPVKRDRYRSITYPQYGNGVRIRDDRVELSGIGSFRLHCHLKLRGRIRTVSMKWQHGRWWCVVTVQLPTEDVYRPAPAQAPDLGGDPGLTALMTFSDGSRLDPPKALRERLTILRREQRKLSRKFEHHKARVAAERQTARAEGRDVVDIPLSNRLRAQIRKVGQVHTKVVNVRGHHQKLGARRTADRCNRLFCEDHSVQFMFRNRKLARAAADRAIAQQKHAFASAMGPRFVPVPNRRPGIGGNSQSCLCGAPAPKALSERWHSCAVCGLEAPRDEVSARICLQIGLGQVPVLEAGKTNSTAPGRGSSDVENATDLTRESAQASDMARAVSARAFEMASAPAGADGTEASTSRFLSAGENTACGHGRVRKAKLANPSSSAAGLQAQSAITLGRAPKPPLRNTLRKHRDLSR